MAKCNICGKKSIFLRLNQDGLCTSCFNKLREIKKYKEEHEIDILYDVYNYISNPTYILVTPNGRTEKKTEKNDNVKFWDLYMNPQIYNEDKENLEYYLLNNSTIPKNCKYYILGSLHETTKPDKEESRALSVYYLSEYLKEPALPQAVSHTHIFEMRNITKEQHHLFLVNFHISKMLSVDSSYDLALEYMLAAFDICICTCYISGLYDAFRKANKLPEFLKKLDYYYDKANFNKDMKKDTIDNHSGYTYTFYKLEAEIKISKNYIFKPRKNKKILKD